MVYIDVDNRERAKPRDKKQRRLIPKEKTHETFKVVVRKWEMLVATKVKMSGSEKKKELNRNTYNISSMKRVTWKFLEVSRYSCAKQWQRK